MTTTPWEWIGRPFPPLEDRRFVVGKGRSVNDVVLPGMIMAAVDLLQRQAQLTDLEIRQAIAGNLCRCTGYMQIVEAIKAASEMLPR